MEKHFLNGKKGFQDSKLFHTRHVHINLSRKDVFIQIAFLQGTGDSCHLTKTFFCLVVGFKSVFQDISTHLRQ